MLKKWISVVCVLSILFSMAIVGYAEGEAALTIDDITGNVIKFGRFDTQADVDGFLRDEGNWEGSKDFTYEFDTQNTYQNSLGSLKVTQKNSYFNMRQAVVPMRRNQWYHLSGAIKLSGHYEEDTQLEILFTNEDSYDKWTWWGLNNNRKLPENEWFVIDEYLQTPVAVADKNNVFSYASSDEKPLTKNYRIALRVKRGDNGQEASMSTFYLDELSLTPVNGNMAPNMTSPADNGYYTWGGTKNPEYVDFNAETEGVADLVAAGEFPNVNKVMRIKDDNTNETKFPFSQQLALEEDTPYDVSFWVKGASGSEDKTPSSEYCKFIPKMVTTDGNYPGFVTQWGKGWAIMGKTYAKKGEWTHIKFQVMLPKTASKACDGWIELAYNDTIAQGDAGAKNGAICYIAEYSIKKSENIIKNPYFMLGRTTPRNPDEQEYGQANTGCTNHWSNGIAAYTNSTTGVLNEGLTYDGNKTYGTFTISEETPYAFQVAEVQSNRKYKLSAWVKAAEGTPVFVIGDKIIKGSVAATRGGWSKITAENAVPNTSGAQNVGVAFIDANDDYLKSGQFNLTDFKVTEQEEPIVIDDITIGELSKDTPMTVAVTTQNIQPYAGVYRYLVKNPDTGASRIASAGEIATGESIPPLAYDRTYGGSEIVLSFRPMSIYGAWGTEMLSNAIRVPAEQVVAATISNLEIDNENDDPISDLDSSSNFGGASKVCAYALCNSQKDEIAAANIVLAAYDEEDRLLKVEIAKITIGYDATEGTGETAKMDVSSGSGVAKVVAMAWSDSMIPLCTKVISVK